MDIPAATGRRSSFRTWVVPAAGGAAIFLLIYLIAELGPSRIAAQMTELGSILPLILLITAAKYPLQAAGWRMLLAPCDRPSWSESVSATISGDALGYLTWAGPFTGEPIRAFLLRDSVRVAAGTAAGAMERAIYNATAALLVWVVLFVLASTAHTVALIVVGVGSAAVSAAIVAAVRRRLRADRTSVRLEPASAAADRGHRAADFLFAARELWRTRRGVLPAVAMLCLVQHALLVTEAFVILKALSPDTTLKTAFVFEAVTKIVNTAGMVVPGRLGIAEGGSALLADALGFAASYGLSLALMRRVRALIWAAVGLALVPLRESRARRGERQRHSAASTAGTSKEI